MFLGMDDAHIKIKQKDALLIWASVINAAYYDIWDTDQNVREAAIGWVKSFRKGIGSFAWICEHLNLNADNLRRNMFANKPRTKYAPLHGKYSGGSKKYNQD